MMTMTDHNVSSVTDAPIEAAYPSIEYTMVTTLSMDQLVGRMGRMLVACDREIRRANFWALTGAGLVFASLLAFYLFGQTWSRIPALVGVGAFLLGVGYGGAARRIKAAGK